MTMQVPWLPFLRSLTDAVRVVSGGLKPQSWPGGLVRTVWLAVLSGMTVLGHAQPLSHRPGSAPIHRSISQWRIPYG